MTFASLDFILFCIPVLFWLSYKKHLSTLALFLISFVFYATSGVLLPLIALMSASADLYIARKIARGATSRPRFWLWVGVVFNLSLLVIIKSGVQQYILGPSANPIYSTIVPIGISFYSLQGIGFLFDVYRKKLSPPKSAFDYLAYILFFPQLLAGPIERAGTLIPQLVANRLPEPRMLVFGLKLFSAGLYLKLVVANRLADPISKVANSSSYDLIYALNAIGMYLYTYSDFFAYTLMARGVAVFFGIKLNLNFNRPFAKRSITSFWQSWHMSLTKWMTDYVYIPLVRVYAGSKASRFLLTLWTMSLVGLWHGFGWNFLVFGLLNGLGLRVNRDLATWLSRRAPGDFSFWNRILLILILVISGNFFLFESSAAFRPLLDPANYEFFNLRRATALPKRELVCALIAASPFIAHEFSSRLEKEFHYPENGQFNSKRNLLLIALFSLGALFFYKEGGAHVYYEF